MLTEAPPFVSRGIPQPQISDLTRSVRQDLALSQEGLARLLGLSNRTIHRWESGTNNDTPHKSREQLRVYRLHFILHQLPRGINPATRLHWLTTPNETLEDGPPIDFITSDSGTKILQRLAQQQHSGLPPADLL